MDGQNMIAVPPEAHESSGEYVAGIVCPDCAGSLTVRGDGREHFSFRCRVGHVYVTPELLAAKEHRLEQHLWSAVAALEELIAMLRDLGCDRARMERAKRDALAIRVIIEGNEPVRLDATSAPPQEAPEESL